MAVFLTVFAIMVGLLVAAAVGIVQLVTLMPQYSDQIQQELSGLQSRLAGIGVTQADIQSVFASISPSQITAFAESLLSSISGVFSFVLFMLVVAIFLAVDATVFGERMAKLGAGHEPVLNALGVFARGTRKYFGVATIFGGIVAILDGAALLILGIPAAGLWALLAFVTNYIPNIGFIIGLIPPAILGLLVGGPGLMIAVIVGVLRAELHHPVRAATEIRRRRGRADHHRELPLADRLGLHPGTDRRHPGDPGQPVLQGAAGRHGPRRPMAGPVPRRQAGVQGEGRQETAAWPHPSPTTPTHPTTNPAHIDAGPVSGRNRQCRRRAGHVERNTSEADPVLLVNASASTSPPVAAVGWVAHFRAMVAMGRRPSGPPRRNGQRFPAVGVILKDFRHYNLGSPDQ